MGVNRILSRAVVLALSAPWVMPLGAAESDEAEATTPEGPECEYCADYRGTRGWVELGGQRQSDASYRFGRYSGLEDDGQRIHAGGWILHRGEHGWYYEMAGSELGLDSRDARVEGGKQGRFSLELDYDETPFYEHDSTSSPFRERTDTHLGLPALWVSAPNTRGMPLLPLTRSEVDLETQRKKGEASFSYIPLTDWEIRMAYSRENKDGRNDQGATFGFGNTVILPVPVDQHTDDYDFSVSYSGERLQSKLAYHGSVFENDQDAITWRNPYVPIGSYQTLGRMSTPPDNQLHRVSATVGYDLLKHTRLTGQLSLGQITQDDELLPYTTNPVIPVGGLTIGMLNAGILPPISRLAQRLVAPGADDLDAEVDTTLAKLKLSSRPLPRLRLNASYTYSDRDNQTNQLLRWYALTDVARSANPRANLPYGATQQLARVSAGYRLPILDSDLEIGFDHDRIERSFQEVDETTEQTAWAKLKLRPHDMVEATLDYAHADRDGSDYGRVWWVFPPQNWLGRIYNLSDRRREKAGAGIALTPLPSVTLSGRAEQIDDDYQGGALGLREVETRSYTLDASFAPIEQLSLHAYYTWEDSRSEQAGGQSRLFPQWTSSEDADTDSVGVGASWRPIADKLELSADLVQTDYRGDIDYTQLYFYLPAFGYPRQDYDSTRLELEGKYQVSEKLGLGVAYRHERYDESRDWAREGLLGLPTVMGLRAAAQEDYDVDLFAAYLRYKF